MTTEVTTWLHKPQSEGGDFAEHRLYTLWGAYPDAPVGRAILSRIFVEIGRELREHTEPEPPLWYAQRYLDIARSLTTADDGFGLQLPMRARVPWWRRFRGKSRPPKVRG